jgi:hypothetical protein
VSGLAGKRAPAETRKPGGAAGASQRCVRVRGRRSAAPCFGLPSDPPRCVTRQRGAFTRTPARLYGRRTTVDSELARTRGIRLSN